ncbi:MAG: FtsX-like permease family protein, partial [Longimicrobiales bacterium]
SNVVTPGYFKTMDIELVAGRDFAEIADEASAPQAIVSEAFVRRYLGAEQPLGRRLGISGRQYEIIGVARNSVADGFGEPTSPTIYLSYRDRPAPMGQMHIRTVPGHEQQFASGMRGVVAAIDPALTVYDVRTLRDHIDINLGLRKIPARMFMALGPLLLALAAIGVYAVVAYAVAQRTAEIGVRLALGASSRRVIGDMVRDHLLIVATGAAVGVMAAAWVYVRLLRQTIDWPVFAGIPLLLLLVSTVAAWIPARRASRVDPVVALRAE